MTRLDVRVELDRTNGKNLQLDDVMKHVKVETSPRDVDR